MKIPLFVALAAAVVVPASFSASPSTKVAQEFLGTLTAEQRAQAVYPIGSDERTKWMYVPGNRKGISWGEMTEVQKAAATKLLMSSVSKEGYAKIEAIRGLEDVLKEMEKNPGRDHNRYWFVFFGAPSDSAPWVWRYEGHHVSLTFGNRNGLEVSSTPQFLGSNPAEVRSGAQKGKFVLYQEKQIGFKLLESLSEAQRAKAIVSSDAPGDIVTNTMRNASIKEHKGLRVDEMTREQKAIFDQIVKVYADVQAPAEARRRLKEVADDKNVVFAWLGSSDHNGKHYYRIQGDAFLIEYDNTQNDANHIHTVWRDFKGDFGDDALAQHYASYQHDLAVH